MTEENTDSYYNDRKKTMTVFPMVGKKSEKFLMAILVMNQKPITLKNDDNNKLFRY